MRTFLNPKSYPISGLTANLAQLVSLAVTTGENSFQSSLLGRALRLCVNWLKEADAGNSNEREIIRKESSFWSFSLCALSEPCLAQSPLTSSSIWATLFNSDSGSLSASALQSHPMRCDAMRAIRFDSMIVYPMRLLSHRFASRSGPRLVAPWFSITPPPFFPLFFLTVPLYYFFFLLKASCKESAVIVGIERGFSETFPFGWTKAFGVLRKFMQFEKGEIFDYWSFEYAYARAFTLIEFNLLSGRLNPLS